MQPNFKRFISPNQIQRELLCYSDGMGFDSNPDFWIDRPSFNNYLIMYTLSGVLWCCQNDEKIAVYPGEYIFIDLHRPHRYYFEKGVPSRIAWVHLNGSPIVQIVRRFTCPLPIKRKDPEFYRQIHSFFELSDRPDPDIFEQSAACYALLLRIFSETCHETQKPVETARCKEFKMTVWEVISHNLHRNISVDELARSVSLSKYHFIRIFRDVFGDSPIRFITAEKIRQAKYQLTNTAATVSDVSEALGFATPSYFTKVFKRDTGYSPSEYRQYGYLRDHTDQTQETQ